MRRSVLVIVACLVLTAPWMAAQDAGAMDAAPQSVAAQVLTGKPAPDDPPWFKHLHVLAGMALGLSAAELVSALQPAQAVPGSPLVLPLVALSAAAAAGAGKELLDSTGFGDPRFSDIVVTTIGGIAAAGVIGFEQALYPAGANGRLNAASFLLTTAALLAVPVVIGFVGEIASYAKRLQGRSGAAGYPAPAP